MRKYAIPIGLLIVGFFMVLYGWTFPYIPYDCMGQNPCIIDETPSYFTSFFGYFVLLGGGIWMAIIRRKKITAKPI